MTPTKRGASRNSEGETTPSNSFKRRRQSLMDDYVGSVSHCLKFVPADNPCTSYQRELCILGLTDSEYVSGEA